MIPSASRRNGSIPRLEASAGFEPAVIAGPLEYESGSNRIGGDHRWKRLSQDVFRLFHDLPDDIARRQDGIDEAGALPNMVDPVVQLALRFGALQRGPKFPSPAAKLRLTAEPFLDEAGPEHARPCARPIATGQALGD